jgi:hypothetical protein
MREHSWVELPDAVRGIRQALTKAASEGATSGLRFEVETVELEFAVDVRREADGQAGVKVWVASLSTRGARSRQTTHRLKVALRPKTRDGGPHEISDKSDRPFGE